MIINLGNPREKYFADWTVAEILRGAISTTDPVTVADVQELDTAGKVAVGTQAGNLESLLEGEYVVDSLSIPKKVKQLPHDHLFVLPPNYRIPAGDAHHLLAYSSDTLVKLDAAEVKRALLGPSVPEGPLSAKRKQQEEWQPEKVIGAAFDFLYQNRDALAEQTLSCYSWWGKDHHRRIVSLYRAIQGAELRAFQNYAGFRLLIRKFRKELRTNKNAQTKEPLTPQESADKTAKVQRYECYLEVRDISKDIRQLDVFFTDLIEPRGGFSYQTGQTMRVPSRSKIKRGSLDPKDELYRKVEHQTYVFKLTDVPLLVPKHQAHFSLPWEVAGNCSCPDKTYRSDRRKSQPDKGSREDFFCPHEIAAFHTLRKKQEGDDPTIRFLPFVLPTAEMMDYVDKLRYQTVMLTRSEETGRWSKRALNHTEMENLLWKKVMADGYEACFTTDIQTFKDKRYDPHLDLIKLVR